MTCAFCKNVDISHPHNEITLEEPARVSDVLWYLINQISAKEQKSRLWIRSGARRGKTELSEIPFTEISEPRDRLRTFWD
jgi:hypothetical protein